MVNIERVEELLEVLYNLLTHPDENVWVQIEGTGELAEKVNWTRCCMNDLKTERKKLERKK